MGVKFICFFSIHCFIGLISCSKATGFARSGSRKILSKKYIYIYIFSSKYLSLLYLFTSTDVNTSWTISYNCSVSNLGRKSLQSHCPELQIWQNRSKIWSGFQSVLSVLVSDCGIKFKQWFRVHSTTAKLEPLGF